MADYVHKTTLALHLSMDPSDLPEAVGNYLVNPDMTVVGTGVGNGFHATVPFQYWKLDEPGNAVLEMTAGEKAAVDAAAAAALIVGEKESAKVEIDRRVFKAFLELQIEAFNTLRAFHSLAPYTMDQLRTALRDKVDAG